MSSRRVVCRLCGRELVRSSLAARWLHAAEAIRSPWLPARRPSHYPAPEPAPRRRRGGPWRAPRDGGYHPTESVPEPTTPPRGGAGHSSGAAAPARGGPDTAGMREELAAVLLAATTDYGTGKASPEVDLFDFYADALLPVVQRLAVEKAAEELRAAAKAWQWGAWADTPRHADRIADRIGAAQYVTDWLLARAAALASPAPAPRAEEGQW